MRRGSPTLPPGAAPSRPPAARRGALTLVHTVDASDARTPTLLYTIRLQGGCLCARSVGRVATPVLASTPPASLGWTRPWTPRAGVRLHAGGRPPPAGRTAVRGPSNAQAAAANQALVVTTGLDDWFPRYHTARPRGVPGDVTTGYIAGATTTYRPAAFSGSGLLPIVTLPLAAGAPACASLGRAPAVFAHPHTVYASVGSVNVATAPRRRQRDNAPVDGQLPGWAVHTAIHQFAVHRGGLVGATYVGSGVVAGRLLNAFSMHEADGTCFIATTTGEAGWTGPRDAAASEITALRRAAGAPTDGPSPLVAVGRVGDLGRGERIVAVRYVGLTAYVVTFRQVDPLYVISLADPTAMVATGELSIPGYSSYLHPLGPGRLLGVGHDAAPVTGRSNGVKVALFDVSDVRAPRELATWTDAAMASSSSVWWDHRAFLYWPPARLAILPIRSRGGRGGTTRFAGSIVLRVAEGDLTEVGRITHPPRTAHTGRKKRVWHEAVERNLVLGRQWLWTLSPSRFQVQVLDDLLVSGYVVFPEPAAEG